MAGDNRKEFIFVGLGNPGKQYEMTRHNIGNLVVQSLAKSQGLAFKDESRFQAQVTKGVVDNVKVHLVLPTTYMNESGVAVRRYIDFFKLDPQAVVVVSDDIDLPFGHMRLRESGSAGTHNGLKSVEKHIGTQKYPRLRMGIGAGHQSQELASHVLSRFDSDEAATLDSFVDKGVNVLLRIVREEMTSIMNDVNRKVNKKQKTDLLQVEGQEKNNDSR
ncbi:MAG: aminoacyl-tRNA hydrolase [Chlamydiota bacterium]|nr:aminoacyl-tRNA hydrolase [Chlamydiota bacterium]